jgi:hypothetical protein
MEFNIRHGIFGGIDTRHLEERMRSVDWQKHPGNWFFDRDDPTDIQLTEMRSIEKEMDKLMRLEGKEDAGDIWEQLMVKYYSGTPLEYAISQNVPYLEASFTQYHELMEKTMNTAVNFYELKTRLADLGFSEPTLVDALRETILTAEYAVISAGYQEMIGEQRFIGWFEFHRDMESGMYELEQYQVMLYDKDRPVADMMLDKDISKTEALKVLRTQLGHEESEQTLYWPMTRKDMESYLGTAPVREPGITEHLIQKQAGGGFSQYQEHKYYIQEQLTKQQIMNTQNLDFLKKSLLNLGFGEQVNEQLEKNITKKVPEFSLTAQHEFNQKKVDYNLHFKAGENQEMYFFNKFDATLNKGKEKEMNQTFYINKGNGVTAKEAFNLMEGRAVHKQLFNKDGEKYQAWLQLDNENPTQNGNKEIKRFNENYGFKLEEVIVGKGIKELGNYESEENLMRSLKKGNLQQITVERNGEEKKYFISASPQYKTVDLYDHQMKKIKREELLQPEQKQSNNKKQSEQQKEDAPKKKRSKRNKIGA